MELPKQRPGLRGAPAFFHMTKNVPVVRESATVYEIKQLLSKSTEPFETINYIYFVDDTTKLVGVLSIKKLLRLNDSEIAFEKSDRKIVTARLKTGEERIALFALKHSLKAVPIVDASGHLEGVVPSDSILSTLHDRAIEDVLRSVGVVNPRTFDLDSPPLSQVSKRIPWLIVGLSGSFVGAIIINSYGEMLRGEIVIAAFIPVIVYITGAVGVQVETILIRSLSLDPRIAIFRYFFHQLSVTVLIALLLSLIAFIGISFVWSPRVAIVFSGTMLVTIMVATVVSSFMPWILSRFRIDPAIASGPFSTTLRDVTTIFIYLSIAYFLLSVL